MTTAFVYILGLLTGVMWMTAEGRCRFAIGVVSFALFLFALYMEAI